MSTDFATLECERARADVCSWLGLNPDEKLVLVSGGGEGIGPIKEITRRLMRLESAPQIIVVTGNNEGLQSTIEGLLDQKADHRVRVLSWTDRIAELMRASDVMISKLGNTFDEAIAAELPIVALRPPPGSERVQYRLLGEWGVGCAVRTIDQMTETIAALLQHPDKLEEMRGRARVRSLIGAGEHVAAWIKSSSGVSASRPEVVLASQGW
jgi:UDP-N-acetylglucosamine:LPS N-acetylglucosamine transferase